MTILVRHILVYLSIKYYPGYTVVFLGGGSKAPKHRQVVYVDIVVQEVPTSNVQLLQYRAQVSIGLLNSHHRNQKCGRIFSRARIMLLCHCRADNIGRLLLQTSADIVVYVM